SLVAEYIEQLLKNTVLNHVVPCDWQIAKRGSDRLDLALTIHPGRNDRQKYIGSFFRHVAPGHRPFLVHRDRIAIDPKYVQAEVAQQIVTSPIGVGLNAIYDVGRGGRFILKVALDHCRELLKAVERRE